MHIFDVMKCSYSKNLLISFTKTRTLLIFLNLSLKGNLFKILVILQLTSFMLLIFQKKWENKSCLIEKMVKSFYLCWTFCKCSYKAKVQVGSLRFSIDFVIV